MKGQTFILRPHTRGMIAALIKSSPDGYVVNVRAPNRSADQNAKMWAMLSDVSRARPEGRTYSPEVWKTLFMSTLGYEAQFAEGLNGEPVPLGFRTSRLRKAQMSDLIECIYAYGAKHGVRWTEAARHEVIA